MIVSATGLEREWAQRERRASLSRGRHDRTERARHTAFFDNLAATRRESFYFAGWPVEAFIHDPATLVHFVRSDLLQGRPCLAHMIADAIVVPESTPWSDWLID